MSVCRLAHFFVVALLVAACSNSPTRVSASGATNGKVDESAVTGLYSRLDAAVLRFETADDSADGAAAGSSISNANAALDELRSAALECHRVAGCEEDRFLAAFDGLLRRAAESAPGASNPLSDNDSPETADAVDAESSGVAADLPQVGRTITLLKGKPLAEVIAMNGPVKVALEEWLSQYRPNLIQAYINYQYLRYQMWPEYQRAGLPEALLFGMLAKESGGKVHAVSRSGASGPLQFMYTTGLRFGLSSVNGFDQRFDPALSTRANAAYLNEQLRIFNNDLELVIAAYNGGEGRMRRLAGGGGHFWDPQVYSALSEETREYVPMVLAAAWLFLHPDRYNLTFPQVDNHPGKVTLLQPASLTELSVCFGQAGDNRDGWFRALRNLNPALNPQQAIAAGTVLQIPAVLEPVYVRDCADGNWRTLAQDLHSAVTPAVAARRGVTSRSTAAVRYTVRKGDTLSAIARRHRCGAPQEIARLNRLHAPHYAIRAGQSLQIPSCSQ